MAEDLTRLDAEWTFVSAVRELIKMIETDGWYLNQATRHLYT